MPKYETMLVTSTTLDEEASIAVVAKFKALIEANGTIDGVEEWGKRRLAYPINKENDGVYTLIHFTSGADFPAELDRVYKITDGVLRSLIIAKQPGQEYVPPAVPKATPEATPAAVEATPEQTEPAGQVIETAGAGEAPADAKPEAAEAAGETAASEEVKEAAD